MVLVVTILIMYVVSVASSFRYNGSCSANIECLPRETFMRCIKGRCLCAADSDYDFRNGYCRLKINVKCYLSGKNIQPCVRGAFCDPPTLADGSKILAASSGNCKCYQGENNEEDGTCTSAANTLQRSFGYSSLIFGSAINSIVVVMSIGATMFNCFCWRV